MIFLSKRRPVYTGKTLFSAPLFGKWHDFAGIRNAMVNKNRFICPAVAYCYFVGFFSNGLKFIDLPEC